MSRPRKPAEQLRLAGTDKKHGKKPDIDWSGNYGEADGFTVTEMIPPPRKYRKETKEAWRRVMALEIERGILSAIDMPLFGMMFDSYDHFIILSEAIDKALRDCGKEGKNPESVISTMKMCFKIRNQEAAQFAALASKFLINPGDRQRLGIDLAPQRKTSFDLLLAEIQDDTPYRSGQN